MLRRARRSIGTLLTVCALAGAGTAASAIPAQAATASVTCSPKTVTHVAAPGAWRAIVVKAGIAGWVTLAEKSPPSIAVRAVAPNLGWKATTITRAGTRVHMSFSRSTSAHLIRFYARINAAGTRLTMVTVVCT
jgi:hypothetical protein